MSFAIPIDVLGLGKNFVHILLNLVESGIMCVLQGIYRFFNPGWLHLF